MEGDALALGHFQRIIQMVQHLFVRFADAVQLVDIFAELQHILAKVLSGFLVADAEQRLVQLAGFLLDFLPGAFTLSRGIHLAGGGGVAPLLHHVFLPIANHLQGEYHVAAGIGQFLPVLGLVHGAQSGEGNLRGCELSLALIFSIHHPGCFSGKAGATAEDFSLIFWKFDE